VVGIDRDWRLMFRGVDYGRGLNFHCC